jgi:DNA primase
MKKLALPRCAGELILAIDGDAAGREAGNELAYSAKKQGWSVSTLAAPDGTDWNDHLIERIQE